VQVTSKLSASCWLTWIGISRAASPITCFNSSPKTGHGNRGCSRSSLLPKSGYCDPLMLLYLNRPEVYPESYRRSAFLSRVRTLSLPILMSPYGLSGVSGSHEASITFNPSETMCVDLLGHDLNLILTLPTVTHDHDGTMSPRRATVLSSLLATYHVNPIWRSSIHSPAA
jgi:hypothetical protein